LESFFFFFFFFFFFSVFFCSERFGGTQVRKVKKSSEEKEEKRALGLVLLRGENIVSLSVDGPPPLSDRNTFRKPPQGVGALGAVGVPAGRGLGEFCWRTMCSI
jgi:hypothetical protein